MRTEILRDEMILNCFKALQNNLTDFEGFKEKLSSLIMETITEHYDMEFVDDMEFDSDCVVKFFEEEQCILVVEVIA